MEYTAFGRECGYLLAGSVEAITHEKAFLEVERKVACGLKSGETASIVIVLWDSGRKVNQKTVIISGKSMSASL